MSRSPDWTVAGPDGKSGMLPHFKERVQARKLAKYLTEKYGIPYRDIPVGDDTPEMPDFIPSV